MNSLIESIFKPTVFIKFASTEYDCKAILSKIRSLNLFNLKEKSTKQYEIGYELSTTTYKDEIFLFKEICLHIVQDERDKLLQIPYFYFDTEEYISKLHKIYQDCLPIKEPSLIKKGTNILKSFIIDNFMDDKKKADSFFLAKMYHEAYVLYSKYNDYNDFSHYCIEMSIYCKLEYFELPKHFIDTFYFKRMVFLLFESKEFDLLCFLFYKKSLKISADFMYRIGLRLYTSKKYYRKGLEIMHFYKGLSNEQTDCLSYEINKSIKLKKWTLISNRVFFLDLIPKIEPFELSIFNLNINNFINFYLIYQYEEFKIFYKCNSKGKFRYKNSEHEFDSLINFKIYFTELGFKMEELIFVLDKNHKVFLYFMVLEKFKFKITFDYRLRSRVFLKLSNLSREFYDMSSDLPFLISKYDNLTFIKKDILGITESSYTDTLGLDSINDPIFTNLDYIDFFQGGSNNIKTDKDICFSIDRYNPHQIKIRTEKSNYIYNINVNPVSCNKIFVYIFNTYTITSSLKLNMLVNNYLNQKLYLQISNIHCNVIDDNFILLPEISSLFEFRCTGFSKDMSFDIKITDEKNNFIDYDLITEIL